MTSPQGGSSLRERRAATIIEAAAAVFAEPGGAASMADVAREAGVARATVYRYFPSREALLEALPRRSLRVVVKIRFEVDPNVPPARRPLHDALEQLRELIFEVSSAEQGEHYADLIRAALEREADRPD